MEQGRLTAEQVHNVVFSKPPLGMRRYHEDEVDAFLEAVAAQLQPGSGAPSVAWSHACVPAPEPKGRRFLNGVAAMVRWIAD